LREISPYPIIAGLGISGFILALFAVAGTTFNSISETEAVQLFVAALILLGAAIAVTFFWPTKEPNEEVSADDL
jgi:hypothetical protein